MSSRPTRDCSEGHHRRCVLPASCPCRCHQAARPQPKLTASTAAHTDPVFRLIAIDEIYAGNNIRLEGDITQLAKSIQQHGILQPITVVEQPDGTVECIFGHRRLAAAFRAGLTTVPCLIRPADTKQVRVLTQVAENRDRRDMTKLEEALVYAQLRKLGMKQVEIAAAVGVDQTHVSQRLTLLTYPDAIKNAVHRREIGINDALAVPLELAERTDGRTLAAVCRRGGQHLRQWVDTKIANHRGPLQRRALKSAINIDARLADRIRVTARAQGTDIGAWCERVLAEALDRA